MPILTTAQLNEIRETNSLLMSRDRWGATYEHLTFALYYAVLRAGDTAVDCGANMGDHSRLMAKLCGSGSVFAFEAAPEMMKKAKAGSVDFSNIHFIKKALWDKSGQKKDFHFFPAEHGLSGLSSRDGVSSEHVFETETITLDDAVDGEPVLIKLDIEGAEYHALLGAERLMVESKPVIIFENSRGESAAKFGYDKDDFFSLFHSRGYALYSISGMPFVPDLWDDVGCPWQLVAIHPACSRVGRALGQMSYFMANLR